jgi:hypothetical protein
MAMVRSIRDVHDLRDSIPHNLDDHQRESRLPESQRTRTGTPGTTPARQHELTGRFTSESYDGDELEHILALVRTLDRLAAERGTHLAEPATFTIYDEAGEGRAVTVTSDVEGFHRLVITVEC